MITILKAEFVFGHCDKCGMFFSFLRKKNKNAKKQYYEMRESASMDLCSNCFFAHLNGYYDFVCDGCRNHVSGDFTEVGVNLNCNGHAFCNKCREGYYGLYNPKNPALMKIINDIITNNYPEHSGGLGVETKYISEVRYLTRKRYKTNNISINKEGLSFESSKYTINYHIDHIVPVSYCFNHKVSIEDALSPHNIQIIPSFVNLSKNNYFNPENMIDIPVKLRDDIILAKKSSDLL